MTALSLVYPVQNLISATAIGFGVGINAVIAFFLGAGDKKKANQAATMGMFWSLVQGLTLSIVCILIMPKFLTLFTDDATVIDYAIRYSRIAFLFGMIISSGLSFEKTFQAVGRMKVSMLSMMAGCISNIVLDPILIFGLFGFPRMEVAGAAVATVTGQIVAAVAAIILNQKKNHEVKINMKGFRPSVEVIAQIYEIGIPSIVMQAISSVMTYGMNLILISFSATATAVFGIYFKLQSFIFMPVFGLNNGVIPIVAYNYGAQKRDRVLSAIRHVITYAVVIMILGLVIFQTIPDKLLMMFSASETMLAIGVPALRTISLSFLLAGFCIAAGSVFQALGKSIYSMYVSVARQLVVLLPVAYALSRLGRVELVWWAIPIAELMSLAMTVICMIHINKNIISKIGKNS